MNVTFRNKQTLLFCGVAAWLFVPAASWAEGGRLASRPLTPQEIKTYELAPETQTSGGLFTVGVGAPVYLEAQVDQGTVVSGVTWLLSEKPAGSNAELTESPLGPEIPIYNPGDREVHDVADRKVLVPDVVGVYTVTATVTTPEGEIALSADVTGALYVGAGMYVGDGPEWPQCALCHEENADGWIHTGHARAFSEGIDGISTDHFRESCIKCHSVGYDPTPGAENGGFDDVARLLGWTFPEELKPGNWEAMPDALKDVSNVQCESCHGPGSEHFGRVTGNRISLSTSSGDCGQCHDAEPYHVKVEEWNHSRHAVATRYPTGEGRQSCVACHSGIGFIEATDGVPTAELSTEWEAIVCAACHDPHSAENHYQLRTVTPVELGNGHVVVAGGNGKLCMNCHKSRRNAEEYVQEYHSHFGPHYGPQGDMIAGSNAIEYGRPIPKSTHIVAVGDSCVTCHLQETSRDAPEHGKAGGHSFKMVWDGDTPDDPSDDKDLTGTCMGCHGPIDSFDLKRHDYDGNGVVEGVQTEIENLLHRLAMLLPPLNEPIVEVTAAYKPEELKAAYNYLFVEDDGSRGVHNATYAAGILKAALADLTGDTSICGDRDDDCLMDDWEILHFGSIEAYDGQDDPDNDLVNNVMEFSVRTLPMKSDSDMDGFSDFDELHTGTDPLNAEDNPDVGKSSIYHAAELVFFTEEGKTYQVQAVAELGNETWTNVDEPFEGTGDMMQMFVSTRETSYRFYRVVEVE